MPEVVQAICSRGSLPRTSLAALIQQPRNVSWAVFTKPPGFLPPKPRSCFSPVGKNWPVMPGEAVAPHQTGAVCLLSVVLGGRRCLCGWHAPCWHPAAPDFSGLLCLAQGCHRSTASPPEIFQFHGTWSWVGEWGRGGGPHLEDLLLCLLPTLSPHLAAVGPTPFDRGILAKEMDLTSISELELFQVVF